MPDELDQMLSSLEGYWAIVRRRRWWILIPVFLVWAAVWGIGWLLPETYQSEALILLEQPSVPNQFVTPNVNATVQDRLQTIQQQILSRTRLQAIINRYHLYPEPHGARIILEAGDPIEKMRKDIDIEFVTAPGHSDQFTAFKMRYTAKSPALAQKVNEDLTSPFVTEDVEAQEQLSEDTTSFLDNQLAEARSRMEEQEAKVAAFKAKHPGVSESPLEAGVQQILTGLQSQLQSSQQTLESARQHKLYLESLIQQAQSAPPAGGANPSAAAGVDPALAMARDLDRELIDLRLRLQDLRQQYTDDYPDVVALKDKIAQREKMKKTADDEAAANLRNHKTATAADAAGSDHAAGGASASLMQLENQLKASQQDIQAYEKRQGELETEVTGYLTRLKTAPETEQELAGISRDYEESKANYNSLLQKQMQSQLATRLEERQKSEQFRILDPPSFPKKHISPNHFRFSGIGLMLGLVVAIAITAILEIMDIRIRHERDLKALVPAHLLVTIPRLVTPKEEKSRALRRWLDFGAVTAMILLIAAGNVFAFFKR